MAKEIIANYVFAPGASNSGTVKVPGNVHAKELLVITNTTHNTLVYNFADANTGLQSISYDGADTTTFSDVDSNGVTTITLKADTSTHSAGDALMIYADLHNEVLYSPSDTYRDPVSKIRVSNPENQIDTDFEYGLQATKWESLETVNNIPTLYSTSGDTPLENVQSVAIVTGETRIIVTTLESHGLSVGDPISVQGLSERLAEGFFLVHSVTGANTFAYKSDFGQPSTGDVSGSYTTIIPCKFFASASMNLDEEKGEANTNGLGPESTVTVSTKYDHGLNDKSKMYLRNTYSPNRVSFSASPSSNALDGRPHVDTSSSTSVSFTINPLATTGEAGALTYPIRSKYYEGLWCKYFDSTAVDTGSNRITWTNHYLQTGFCLLFSMPKDGFSKNDAGSYEYHSDGGLEDGTVYYVNKVDDNTIELYENVTLNNTSSGQSVVSSIVNLTSPTYTNCLSLVYRSVGSGNPYNYLNRSKQTPYYYYSRSTSYQNYSGADLEYAGYSGLWSNNYNGRYKGLCSWNGSTFGNYYGSGTSNNTYLLGISGKSRAGVYYGNYDPHAEYSYNRQYSRFANRDTNQEYSAGVYNVDDGIVSSGSFYDSSYTLRVTDEIFYTWVKRLENRNTIYKVGHGLSSGDIVTITTNSNAQSERLLFVTSSGALTDVGQTVVAEVNKISNDVFSITTQTGSYSKIAYWPDTTLTFSASVTNPLRDTIYVRNHGIVSDIATVKYESTATPIGGMNSGQEYDVTRINDDRLQFSTGVSVKSTVEADKDTSGSAIGETSHAAFTYYLDIETPAGFEPTSAILKKMYARGDINSTSEYININFFAADGTTSIRQDNYWASQSYGAGNVWNEETGTWTELDITNALVDAGGKKSVKITVDPSSGVNYDAGNPSGLWWEIKFDVQVSSAIVLDNSVGSGTHIFETPPQRGVFDGPFPIENSTVDSFDLKMSSQFKDREVPFGGQTVSGNEISYPLGHGFVTGQKLSYKKNGWSNILPSGYPDTVYAIAVDNSKIKLAQSRDNALNNIALTLGAAQPATGLSTGQNTGSNPNDSDTFFLAVAEGANNDLIGAGWADISENALGSPTVIGDSTGTDAPKFSTTQAKFGSTSAYFPDNGGNWNDSGAGLTWSNSGFAVGNGDFTLEAWQYYTVFGSQTWPWIFSMWDTTTQGRIGVILEKNSSYRRMRLYYRGSSASYNWYTSTSNSVWPVPANQWNHIALVKYGANLVVYVNGVAKMTQQPGLGNSFNPSIIKLNGYGYYNSGTTNPYGFKEVYYEDFRYSKVARYTGDFSSSLPVTFDVAATPKADESQIGMDKATKFYLPSRDMANNSTAFTDIGPHKVPLLADANAKHLTAHKKWDTSSIYVGVYSRIYTDFATTDKNEEFNAEFGSGDWTIDWWERHGSASYASPFYIFLDSVAVFNWQFVNTSPNKTVRFYLNDNTSSTVDYTGATVDVAYETAFNVTDLYDWHHMAIVKESSGSTNYITFYVDGVARHTHSPATAGTYTGTGDVQIGHSSSFNGQYIEDFRISNTARWPYASSYSSGFIPPNKPFYEDTKNDEHLDNTRLLLRSDYTAGTVASSCFLHPGTHGNTTTVANATVDKKFDNTHGKTNSSSFEFDSATDQIYMSSSGMEPAKGNVGTGDYTIEFWGNFTQTNSKQDIFDSRTSTNSVNGVYLGVTKPSSGTQTLHILNNSGLVTDFSLAAGTLSATWQHYALVRKSSTLRLYIDGVMKYEATDNRSIVNAALYIGNDYSGANDLSGYMEEFRITTGVARYLNDFAVPTTIFPHEQDVGYQKLTTSTVTSAISGVGTITTTADSSTILGTDTVFKTTFKRFDPIYIAVGGYQQKFTVENVLTDTKMILAENVSSAATDTTFSYKTDIIPRPDGFNLHRPYDGGVEITAGTSPNSKITRQTRRYFRYQSGKGIQCSIAVNFSPTRTLASLTSSGTTATATCQEPHNLSVGNAIKITDAGVTSGTNFYQGDFTVVSIVDVFSFTYTMSGTPANPTATGFPEYARNGWSGTSLRAGMFDDQNGMFYEYDGQNLYAVRRNSTQQLSGTISVTRNSPVIAGLSTSFLTQLEVDDNIICRGQTYLVVSIDSNTSMTVQPAYRGQTVTDIKITKRIDKKVSQSNWNIDPCDGSGRSKYNLDINKIQMVYMDYSWYGAGTVRFGFKGPRGNVFYCHEFLHNNKETEAYWRTGNMPGRYEVENDDTTNNSPTLMHWGTSIIMDGEFDDDKAYLFTASSNQFAFTGGNSYGFASNQASYFRRYGGKYYYVIRGATAIGSNISTGQLIRDNGNTYIPEGYVIDYTYQQGGNQYVWINYPLTKDYPDPSTYPTIPSGTNFTAGELAQVDLNEIVPLVSVRLAPSVDSGLTGALGEREIINRMLVKLKECSINSSYDVELQLLLNAELSTSDWVRANSPSLCEVIYHDSGDTIGKGTIVNQVKFASGSHLFDISSLLELGNSILGGDGIFPDGPDSLTLAVKPLDSSNVGIGTPFEVSGKITWTESQA